MKSRFNLKFENNSEPSISVAQRYRSVVQQDEFVESLALIHYRGGEEEFQIGKRYLQSDDAFDRVVGADILGQLGWHDQTYLAQSVALLIEALNDSDELVVECVCYALGHRSDPSANAHLIKLAQNPSAKVRYGVVSALLGNEAPEVIDVMIALSRDFDPDVRSWAMFGLGSQLDIDTEQINQALFAGTSDKDSEVRGEALVGLADRNDSRIVELLLKEWENTIDISMLSLEAAAETASPRLYSKLMYFNKMHDFSDDFWLASQLQEAIDACKPNISLVSSRAINTIAPRNDDE